MECLVWGISIMHGEPNVTLFFILLYFGVAIVIIGLMWWATRYWNGCLLSTIQ